MPTRLRRRLIIGLMRKEVTMPATMLYTGQFARPGGGVAILRRDFRQLMT